MALKTNKKEHNYSTEIDFQNILDYTNEDRRYNSVMDEYRRFFSNTRKTKTTILNQEELWEFIKFFYKKAYSLEITNDQKVGKKVFVKREGENVKISMNVFWNKKNWEYSLQQKGEATEIIILRIKPRGNEKFVLIYKKVAHSPTTLWGLKAESKKYFFKYYHKKNAKNVFAQLKRMEEFKKQNGSIKGFEEFLSKGK